MPEQETKHDISMDVTQAEASDEVLEEAAQPGDDTPEHELVSEREEIEQTMASPAPVQAEEQAFDWFALGVVIIAAAIFALAGRFNAQPPNSVTEVAVLSAFGCGLLVTGLRKTRTIRRPGLLEAGLGGGALAFCQFAAALSYPGIIPTLATTPDERAGFLATWALVAILSILFSMAGAVVGHLAFAPLRPAPVKKPVVLDTEPTEPVEVAAVSNTAEAAQEKEPDAEPEESPRDTEQVETEQVTEPAETTQSIDETRGTPDSEPTEVTEVDEKQPERATRRARAWYSYAAVVVLLGLAPTLAGYIFAAAFDYMLGVYHFLPGPYPTLRLLATLLPWQIPVPFDAGSGSTAALLRLVELWRIPLFLGNPTMFDVVALQPYLFTGAGLAVLLLTLRDEARKRIMFSWPIYLLLETILGLLLVLPADVWIMRGLEGLLRFQVFMLPIRTLYILNTQVFIFNIITGPLVCIIVGAGLRAIFSRSERKP